MRGVLALSSVLVQLGAALTLAYLTTDAVPHIWTEGVGVYAIGAWPRAVRHRAGDRPSHRADADADGADCARIARLFVCALGPRRVHFHSLFQFLLMGLNGAFLTGDLFNLFVFFEVLLASSYGLLLHGSGPARVKAGLHYIVVNLIASLAVPDRRGA